MPVHLLLMGPLSAGKNYTVKPRFDALPPEAVITIDARQPTSPDLRRVQFEA